MGCARVDANSGVDETGWRQTLEVFLYGYFTPRSRCRVRTTSEDPPKIEYAVEKKRRQTDE